jgi:hypothetical protein
MATALDSIPEKAKRNIKQFLHTGLSLLICHPAPNALSTSVTLFLIYLHTFLMQPHTTVIGIVPSSPSPSAPPPPHTQTGSDRGSSNIIIICAWPGKCKFREKANNFHKQQG